MNENKYDLSFKDQTNETPEITAVVTSYYEEKSIEEFYAKLSTALESTGRSYEIVMVNDGSSDGTFEKLKQIFRKDPHVNIVMDLFKNAGQTAALTAAITHARGRILFLIDSDLQLDPMDVNLLLEEYDKGYDVVSGYRRDRKDSPLRVIPSKLANYIMRKASKSELTDFGCTFKLYNADMVRAYRLGPTNIFNTSRIISGAKRCMEVPVTHFPRKYGKSGWTFRKLWDFNMDNFMEMIRRPFQIIGAWFLVVAMLFVLRVMIDFIFPFQILEIVSNGLLLNVSVISLLIIVGILCIIGEFTIRNFVRSQNIPKYIIREKLQRKPLKY